MINIAKRLFMITGMILMIAFCLELFATKACSSEDDEEKSRYQNIITSEEYKQSDAKGNERVDLNSILNLNNLGTLKSESIKYLRKNPPVSKLIEDLTELKKDCSELFQEGNSALKYIFSSWFNSPVKTQEMGEKKSLQVMIKQETQRALYKSLFNDSKFNSRLSVGPIIYNSENYYNYINENEISRLASEKKNLMTLVSFKEISNKSSRNNHFFLIEMLDDRMLQVIQLVGEDQKRLNALICLFPVCQNMNDLYIRSQFEKLKKPRLCGIPKQEQRKLFPNPLVEQKELIVVSPFMSTFNFLKETCLGVVKYIEGEKPLESRREEPKQENSSFRSVVKVVGLVGKCLTTVTPYLILYSNITNQS